MRGKLGHVSIVLMLAFTLGWHWTLLQSVGWAQMFYTFVQSSSIREALEKTFDGKHPCQVCNVVQEGKKSESEKLPPRAGKLDLFCEGDLVAMLFPPDLIPPVFSTGSRPMQTLPAPPKPPPRSA